MATLRLGLCTLIFIASMTSLPAVAEDWIYTVRKGDTLWALCEKYTKVKACWLKIGDYNGVKYPRTLAPGTQVRFPVDWLRDPPAPATLAFASGTVTKRDTQGRIQPLKKDDALTIGETLIVAPNSTAVIRFADQSLMSVEEDSVVRFDVLSKFSSTGMVDTRVHLQKGAAQTKVPKSTPSSRFEVSTPSSVAAVRGTDFRVASGPTTTRNEVFEGEVQVANEADKKNLARGLGLLAKKDEGLGQTVELLGAANIHLTESSVLLPFLLDWSDVANALSYRIKFLKAEQPTHVVFSSETSASQFEISASQIEVGCYILQVNAMDALGFQGMPEQKPLCLRKPLDSAQLIALRKIDKDTLRIEWRDVEDAQRYRVEFFQKPDAGAPSDSVEVATNTIDYDFDARQPLFFKIVSLGDEAATRSLDEELHQAHEGGRRSESIFGRILFVLIAIAAVL